MWFLLPLLACFSWKDSKWDIIVLLLLLIFVLLGVWQAGEIIYWLYTHIDISVK